MLRVESCQRGVMPPHEFEVSLKVDMEVYLDVLRVQIDLLKNLVSPGWMRWLRTGLTCGVVS